MANPEFNVREAIGPGVVAGIAGGIVMGMLTRLFSVAHGMGFFDPLKMIAGVVWGPRVLQMGGGAIIVGLMLHMMVSAAFGIVFASLIPRELHGGIATALGGVLGLVIFAVMTFIVLRWTNQFMYEHVHRGMFVIAHLVYGVSLGLVVPLRRAMTTQRRLPDTAHAA